MPSLDVILIRLMRLLPFVTTPNSNRRFHYEFFYPYPDVWDSTAYEPGNPVAPKLPSGCEAAVQSRSSTTGATTARNRDRGSSSGPALGPQPHRYLDWKGLNESHRGRREPFC